MISNSRVAPFVRAVAVMGVAVAVASLTGVAGGVASMKHGPDLVLVSLSRPPVQLAPGSMFSESINEVNSGDRRAPASRTGFYLSLLRHVGPGAIRLIGTAQVPALRGGGKAKASAGMTVPASTPPQSYLLIACANQPHKFKERKTRNDCRASNGRVTVTSGGFAGSGGSGGTKPACVPTRDPTLTSTDPSCFDGDDAHGVFVSGLGDDANPGTMAAPKRTLAAGISTAAAQGKDVYVTEGVFPEPLNVANGVSVFGGYDASWQRSPSHITKITGSAASSDAAYAAGIKTSTTLELLRLAPGTPTTPGGSSYGLRGLGSPGLVLDHVTVLAAAGPAGAAGANGARGATGGDGRPNGGAGGSSAAGNTGGMGGYGGYDGATGGDGAPGLSTTPDQWGGMGGPGGPGGAGGSNPNPGGTGYAGDAGHRGADGAGGGSNNALPGSGSWLTESGQYGQSGSAGHGGGGGGGGGSDGCILGYAAWGGAGGGGGGGGSGGYAGAGGQGGGGSFGIFLESSTGALVRDSSVTASDGGAGGNGGSGGYAGAGGLGGAGNAGLQGGGLCTAGAAAGANGGLGGPGGLGADGGGAAGGPSVAIFGLPPSDTPGTTVSHGQGGAGAPGPGSAGATGAAANYL